MPRGLPLFESIVVFENHGSGAASSQSGGSLQIRNTQHRASTTGYPLTVVVEPKQELAITFYYDSRRFDETTIARLLGHLETLLGQMAAGLERQLWDLQILAQDEERLLLNVWTDTGTEYPRTTCVHELFAIQAAQTPDAVAVRFGNETLTYRELNERANQLAHHLQTLGVGVETFVGICMERSAEIVVGILGILKAGGTYVPLDPTYPQERLAVMLADAQPKAILTQSELSGVLPSQESSIVNRQSSIINLDTDWSTIAQQPTTNPASQPTAANLAYIMYTSGSTGRPKGITIPHRAISRLVCNTNYVAFGPDLCIGMVSNTAFDAATFEIWGALLHGASLVGVPKEVALSPTDFARFIREQGIDTMFLTTALFNQMVRAAPGIFQPLRQLLFGGEAVDPQAVRAVLDEHPPARLLHVYGPTESTTFATWQLVERVAADAPTVPIGRALANTQTYALDRQMRPVPIGVLGELYIGGDGLARDYLGRPDLTAAAFVPNPFSDEAGARLYKTGDLIRYLPDSSIEFVGRADHQVKIRGFRIELGEIETVLAYHPAIRESLVVVHQVAGVDGRAGDKRIAAYLVASPDQTPTVGELRTHVQATLPEYMTPSAFIILDALPLTPNGKVDRKALPAPEEAALQLDDAYTTPRTPIEEVVAGVWANVFDRERVGIHEDFFELGGHSLLATQVISRLRTAFQVDVPLRHLFEGSTVAGLASRIESDVRTQQGGALPPIEPLARNGDLPLSFAQQRLWFIDQVEPGNPAYNMPGGIRLTGALNVAALEASINEIVQRHESLRTTFATISGAATQVVQPMQPLKLHIEEMNQIPPAERETHVRIIAAEEAAHPFDLARGPLFRVRLLQVTEDEHVILFTMHHIVSDEWSLGVLVREVAALYAAFSQEQPSPLPALPIQYPDFAHWQRNGLQGEVLDAQLAYWRQQLGGDLPVMKLPFDHPQPEAPTYEGAIHPFLLSAEVSQALKKLSQQAGVTFFMTLLAALQTWLYRTTGQEDVVVGTDVANRNRLETEGLIGFFVNHLVLRSDLRGNPAFRLLLDQVRDVTLGAYAHQDLPFDRLVSELQPERAAGHTPLFQVLFVFGNPTAPTLELPGLTLSPLKSDLILSKYDLTLFMGERETGMGGAWRYRTERFELATIQRLATHFETLLASIAANPDEQIARLAMMSATAQAQMAEEAARTSVDAHPKTQACEPQSRCTGDRSVMNNRLSLPVDIEPTIAHQPTGNSAPSKEYDAE